MPKFLVKHQGNTHNITHFLKFHPGGTNTISKYKDHEISSQLQKLDHSEMAYKLLQDYKVKEDNPSERLLDDDSLEHLVDWNKGLFYQVGSLGSNYNKWVLSPVDRKLRLFDNDIMEFLTITPWFLIPTVWFPMSAALVYLGYLRMIAIPSYSSSGVASIFGSFFGLMLTGYFVWPLIEYSLHRWIFHFNPPQNSPLLITIHFTLHGLHHKAPFDERRLLFPPLAAAIIVLFFYSIFATFVPKWAVPVLISGGILGYVTYDLIHFHLHYGSPKKGTYLYHMKRYHNQHHFSKHTSGYGISSPIWDYAFGTVIRLKKIAYTLKW